MEFTTGSDIEEWISTIMTIREAGQCEAPKFIKPFHLATLVQQLKLHHATDVNFPEKLESYANAMNLWGVMGFDPPKAIKRPGGRYYPLEALNNREAIEKIANKLIDLISEACTDKNTTNAMCTMMRELIDNCYSHSEADGNAAGYLCAQVWSAGGKAQIAIVDTGVGIRESLMQNRDYVDRLKTENACEMATEFGVTGKPTSGHSGYGLSIARKLLEQNQGILYVRSNHEGYLLSEGKSMSFNTANLCHGTLLVIECDLTKPMNILAIYESLPLPEGMTNDDFNF